MRDSVEEFISGHRDEFDMHTPPDRVWQAIQDKTVKRREFRRTNAWALAASLLFIVGSFAWFHHAQPEVKKAEEAPAIAHTENQEIIQVETYYCSVVVDKKGQLTQYKDQFPDLYSDFIKELGALNSSYTALKEEYTRSADKEVVKQAMVENLQAQVQIIDQQLQIIEQIKSNKNFNS